MCKQHDFFTYTGQVIKGTHGDTDFIAYAIAINE
jgi:hypothetical protein